MTTKEKRKFLFNHYGTTENIGHCIEAVLTRKIITQDIYSKLKNLYWKSNFGTSVLTCKNYILCVNLLYKIVKDHESNNKK